MREFGKVSVKYWGRAKRAGLSTEAKLLGAYLYSCQYGNAAGVFEWDPGYGSIELSIPLGKVSESLSELLEKGFANHCETTGYVLIRGFLDENRPGNPNQWVGVAKIIDLLPHDFSYWPELIEDLKPFAEGFEKASERYYETLCERFGNKEREREKEREKETISSNASRRTGDDPVSEPSLDPSDPEPDDVGIADKVSGNSGNVTAADPAPPEDGLLNDDQAPEFKPADLIAGRFKDFWAEYPRREGRAAADKTFAKKVRERVKGRPTPEKVEKACDFIIEGARRYAAECRAEGKETKYVKMAQGWLNEERYADGTGEDLLDIPPHLRRTEGSGSLMGDPDRIEKLREEARRRAARGDDRHPPEGRA
jgi:hypothetical protein